jgi:hypothetical protein
MPRIVLHIGPHKTGTTYLQARLHENREALRAVGVDYWSGGLEGATAHHKIAEVTRSGDEAALASLLQPLGNAPQDVVILSSENFDLLRAPGLGRLKAALPAGRAVEVVYFARDATELLLSNWQEHAKHGGVLGFHAYAIEHLAAPLASPLLNPCRVLDVYRNAFGADAIKVVDYDGARAAGDIFDAFAMACGCPEITRFGTPLRTNITMELWLAEFMRALNVLALDAGVLRYSNVRQALLRLRKSDAAMQLLLAEAQRRITGSMRPFSLRGSEVERSARRGLRAYLSKPDGRAPSQAPVFRDRGVPTDLWLCAAEGQALVSEAFRKIRAAL